MSCNSFAEDYTELEYDPVPYPTRIKPSPTLLQNSKTCITAVVLKKHQAVNTHLHVKLVIP
jgi:hypothetical protein